jgi:hypothetical protein
MNTDRIDRVVRGMAGRGISRRQVLTTLLAGTGGGALALLNAQPSQAAGCRRTSYERCCTAVPEAGNCSTAAGRKFCHDSAEIVCKG